ncbi:MAG TPA: GIY-YIG nuclease family protein [Casimicrobiaceae bacterium]|jgi:putative endonuclease
MRTFWVYILASRSRVLYVGVTNDLLRRAREHQLHEVPGFTAKYRINRLVHCEETDDIEAAITREKQLKGWRRSKKIELIEATNPTWDDLSAGWFDSALEAKAGPSASPRDDKAKAGPSASPRDDKATAGPSASPRDDKATAGPSASPRDDELTAGPSLRSG